MCLVLTLRSHSQVDFKKKPYLDHQLQIQLSFFAVLGRTVRDDQRSLTEHDGRRTILRIHSRPHQNAVGDVELPLRPVHGARWQLRLPEVGRTMDGHDRRTSQGGGC